MFTASGGRSSIGLNVKTPFFVGGVSRGFVLPVTLEGLAGLEGCVSKVRNDATFSLFQFFTALLHNLVITFL